MKTYCDWYEEAETFLEYWDGTPTLENVIEECKTIDGIKNPVEYGTILYGFINKILTGGSL